MVNKPDYIINSEKTEGIYSVMVFHLFDPSIIKYLDEKNYQRVYEEGRVKNSGKAKWIEIIFKTQQPFYLHIINNMEEDDEQYWLNIYYKAENRKELLFFTTQILKPFKDGTNNNTTTQGQN